MSSLSPCEVFPGTPASPQEELSTLVPAFSCVKQDGERSLSSPKGEDKRDAGQREEQGGSRGVKKGGMLGQPREDAGESTSESSAHLEVLGPAFEGGSSRDRWIRRSCSEEDEGGPAVILSESSLAGEVDWAWHDCEVDRADSRGTSGGGAEGEEEEEQRTGDRRRREDDDRKEDGTEGWQEA